MTNKQKPHYGYYAFRILVGLSAGFIIGGAIILYFFMIPGVIVMGFGLYLLISYLISIHMLNQSESFDFSNLLDVEGNEKALDIGCGLGKVTVGLAKVLPTGSVTGIDIWNTMELSGNCPEAAYRNAKIEGVMDRVTFTNGDVLTLEFPKNTFDIVTASSVLNNLVGDEKKMKAMKEIVRILKPGGTFFLLEPLRNLRGFFIFTPFAFWELQPKEKWIELLNKTGFTDMQYMYRGSGYFRVKKRVP
jgi:ubiquinone/menaquinone biosynthesis C-methylase UbiE